MSVSNDDDLLPTPPLETRKRSFAAPDLPPLLESVRDAIDDFWIAATARRLVGDKLDALHIVIRTALAAERESAVAVERARTIALEDALRNVIAHTARAHSFTHDITLANGLLDSIARIVKTVIATTLEARDA